MPVAALEDHVEPETDEEAERLVYKLLTFRASEDAFNAVNFVSKVDKAELFLEFVVCSVCILVMGVCSSAIS